jgi:hypothetical protein
MMLASHKFGWVTSQVRPKVNSCSLLERRSVPPDSSRPSGSKMIVTFCPETVLCNYQVCMRRPARNTLVVRVLTRLIPNLTVEAL